jgi:hypothetical protein
MIEILVITYAVERPCRQSRIHHHHSNRTSSVILMMRDITTILRIDWLLLIVRCEKSHISTKCNERERKKIVSDECRFNLRSWYPDTCVTTSTRMSLLCFRLMTFLTWDCGSSTTFIANCLLTCVSIEVVQLRVLLHNRRFRFIMTTLMTHCCVSQSKSRSWETTWFIVTKKYWRRH